MEIPVVCGWCKRHLSGPVPKKGQPVSHGICDACRAEHFPETPRTNPGIRIESKERKFTGGKSEVKFFAFEGAEKVGELFVFFGNVKIKRQPAASIYWIGVDEAHRGKGIATKLYEAAQALACARGRVLASDVTLKEGSRGFWEKQRGKGRASRHQEKVAGKKMYRYALSCPATSLNPSRNPSPSRDEMFRQTAEEHFNRFLSWVEKTPPGVVRREALGVSGGHESGYAFELPGLSPKTYLVLTTKGRRGVAGSYSSQATTKAGERVRFVRINLLDRSDRLPDDLADRLQKARGTFIHEFVHLLDSERIPPAAWVKAAERSEFNQASYFRSPLEWNAFFQDGWSKVDAHMRKLKADEFEEVIEQGWRDFLSVNLSAFWHPSWLRAVRRAPTLWKKFQVRARANWDHSVPIWIDARPKRKADEPSEGESQAWEMFSVIYGVGDDDTDFQAWANARSKLIDYVEGRREITRAEATRLVERWEDRGCL